MEHGRFAVIAATAVAAVVGITTTVDLGLAPSWWDEQRIVLLTAMFLVTAMGLAAGASRSALSVGTALALCVPLALGVLSALQAPRQFVALLDVSMHAIIACCVLLFAGVARPKLATATMAFVVAVAGPYVVGILARYVSALLLSMPLGADTLLVGFANPRFPAHLQALTIPLFPLALALAASPMAKAALSVTGALWWMCAIGSGSRTAWIALAAACAVALLLEGQRGSWLRTQFRLGVAGVVLYLVAFKVVPHLLDLQSTVETGRLSEFGSFGARVELWLSSIEAIAAEPWLGLGPMHFAYTNNAIAAHPHNFWLQIAAEWGVAAGIIVAGASVILWLRSVLTARAIQRQYAAGVGVEVDARLAVGIATAVTAWIVGIQADGLMVVPTSQAASAIVLGLACGLVGERVRGPFRPAMPRALAAMVFVPAAAVLLSLPLTAFWQVKEREDAWLKANPGGTMAPRFWQQGWIGPGDDPTARGEAVPR